MTNDELERGAVSLSIPPLSVKKKRNSGKGGIVGIWKRPPRCIRSFREDMHSDSANFLVLGDDKETNF